MDVIGIFYVFSRKGGSLGVGQNEPDPTENKIMPI